MKNWLAFVFGPLFAMDRMPRAECCARRGLPSAASTHAVTLCRHCATQARAFSVSRSSSGNLPPQMLAPPLPVPARRRGSAHRAALWHHADTAARTRGVAALHHEALDVSAEPGWLPLPCFHTQAQRCARHRACGTWCRRSTRLRTAPGSSPPSAAPPRNTPPPSGRPASCAA